MRLLCIAAVALLGLGCADVHTELIPLEGDRPSTGGSAAPPRDGGGEPQPPQCGDHACKCADGEDNDRDDLIDSLDPECTTPIDDDEGSFATSSPKRPLNECEDCFWDGNSSADDDGCAYPAACRRDGPEAMPGPPPMAPPAAMMCRSCEVANRCIDTCRSRTPNGCDCFGCCEVTDEDGVTAHVVLSDECAVKHVNNDKRCPRCVPNPECFNPCGPCEMCFGKSAEDVAAECADGGATDAGVSQCEDGYQPCSGDTACPQGFYCVLGCCIVTVF